MVASPAAITGVPHHRHRPCHRHSQQPPSPTSTAPDVGSRGIDQTFPGSAATHAGSLEVQFFPYAHFELLLWGRMATDASIVMTQLHYYL